MTSRACHATPYIAPRIPDDGDGTCAARSRSARAVRGQAPRWSEMHSRSYTLSEAQVQAFETEPTPG